MKFPKPFFLAGALAASSFVLASCGGDEKGTTTKPEDRVRIGFVTDTNQLNDRGFNHLAYLGIKRAERELGIRFRISESRSAAEYVPNLTRFARDGYDLVIGMGYTQIDAVTAVSKRFPDTNFAIVDVANADLGGGRKNVLGLLFREEQVGYLAGYLAGLIEKRRPGADVISSVAGQKQPPVDRFIAGFQAGAKAAAPGIKTLNGYSQEFDDQAPCQEVAFNQISAGSGVVFQVAGACGLGALDAARQKKVWGIGVDADQSFLGPHILTSAMKAVDTGTFLAIKSVVEGRFKGGDVVYDLKQHGVRLGAISPKVPKEDVTRVRQIEAAIIAGKIKDIPRVLP
jgi:basic membrane protein A and related proteins